MDDHDRPPKPPFHDTLALLGWVRFLAQAVAAPHEVLARKPGTVGGGIRHLEDPCGIAAQRYDAQLGTVYLLRPDQHVVARWRSLNANAVQAALARATGLNVGGHMGQA